jgi:hypothetical protein
MPHTLNSSGDSLRASPPTAALGVSGPAGPVGYLLHDR